SRDSLGWPTRQARAGQTHRSSSGAHHRIKRTELERLRAERLERETLAACQIQAGAAGTAVTGCQPDSTGLAQPRCQAGAADRRTRAAVTLQAAFRGWRVRARCQVAAMPQLRRRISAAYADARRNPERLLLAPRRSALRFARQQLPAPAVAQQLADLRAGTSHSAKLCELLCSQSGAVAALFSLMAGCNRSLPHQHIVLHSVQILHNLIRHSATAASVARECPVKAGDVLTDALVSGGGCPAFAAAAGEAILASRAHEHIQALQFFTQAPTHTVYSSPDCLIVRQELVKASACLLASLVSSAAGVSGGFALSRRAVVRLRETRDALLRRAGLEERRLVSQLKASGALLVRVEPDWVLKRSANQHMASPITALGGPNGRLRQRLGAGDARGGGAWLSALAAGQRRLLGRSWPHSASMRLCSCCCFSSAVSASAVAPVSSTDTSIAAGLLSERLRAWLGVAERVDTGLMVAERTAHLGLQDGLPLLGGLQLELDCRPAIPSASVARSSASPEAASAAAAGRPALRRRAPSVGRLRAHARCRFGDLLTRPAAMSEASGCGACSASSESSNGHCGAVSPGCSESAGVGPLVRFGRQRGVWD
uniref:PDZ domain-containing protein n=1 Tax=Macrostomum lignano TaxID=282301 RepID=A0A1I8JQJ1_9PLAT